jgi:hypothetical protein
MLPCYNAATTPPVYQACTTTRPRCAVGEPDKALFNNPEPIRRRAQRLLYPTQCFLRTPNACHNAHRLTRPLLGLVVVALPPCRDADPFFGLRPQLLQHLVLLRLAEAL